MVSDASECGTVLDHRPHLTQQTQRTLLYPSNKVKTIHKEKCKEGGTIQLQAEVTQIHTQASPSNLITGYLVAISHINSYTYYCIIYSI